LTDRGFEGHEPGFKHTAADPILDEQIKKQDGGWRDAYEGFPLRQRKRWRQGENVSDIYYEIGSPKISGNISLGGKETIISGRTKKTRGNFQKR
jgi:hypothetical protein